MYPKYTVEKHLVCSYAKDKKLNDCGIIDMGTINPKSIKMTALQPVYAYHSPQPAWNLKTT